MTAPQNDDVDQAATDQAAPPKSRGARIDELATRIPNRTAALVRAIEEVDRIKAARADDAAELATILGSTGAAAAMLGITGREFAALRGRVSS